MTNPQFEYIFKGFRRHQKSSGGIVPSRSDFKAFLGMLSLQKDLNVSVEKLLSEVISNYEAISSID